MRYMPTLRLPVFGSRVTTQGSVMNLPPSFGQHCRTGKWLRRSCLADDFLARAGGNRLGKELSHLGQHGQHLYFVEKALRRLHVHELADAVGDFVERIHFERHLHAARRAELVDENRKAAALHVFEQQRRSATCGAGALARDALRHPVGDLGDFQHRIDFGLDALQFAGAVERGDPVAKVVVGQCLPQRSLWNPRL